MEQWSETRIAGSILAAVTLTTVALLPFGWYLGYRSPAAYLLVWITGVTIAHVSLTIAARSFVLTSTPDLLIRVGVIAFAVAVSLGLLLGSLSRITPGYYTGLLIGLSGTCLLAQNRGSVRLQADFLGRLKPATTSWSGGELAHLSVPVVAVAAALLAFVASFAITHASMTLYDSLSYHLYFPARWLQEQRLSIVPTPFSDEAQAYAPANGELLFLLLMLPVHGDLLARLGQLPFWLLGSLTLYALARRLGAERQHAIYPALFFLLSRPVFEQAVGANVDLICAAMFLTSVYLGIAAVERNEATEWMLWGVSVGLYCGTKYVALVYTPVLLLLAVARGFRAKALWAVPGLLAFALPWYARNWLVAGSPIYPASLQIGGMTIASGAFNRAAMFNTVFHTDDVRLFPAIAAHAFGPTLFLFWIPFALLGAVRLLRQGWWPGGFMVLVPVMMVPLYWFGFPVNIDSRFLMPAVGPALLPLAFTFGRKNALVHTAYGLGIVWVLIGVHWAIPANLPWFMRDWLALYGLVRPQFVVAFGLVTAAMALTWSFARRGRWAVSSMALAVCSTAVVVGLGGERWCRPERCEYLDTTSPYIRAGLIDGWRWLAAHTGPSTVAYTGINLPYPLFGDRLENHVVYVNIDGHARWRFHDYDRAYRTGRFTPSSPPLATASGELQPVARRPGPRDDAVRPRYERMEGFRDGWISNLQTLGVTHLFVSMLSAYEIDNEFHNEGGFPVEDEWARSNPGSFHLLYENSQVRIYAVMLPSRAGA
jgi:hypothetical protein